MLRVRDKPWWMRTWNRRATIAFFGTVYLPKGFRAAFEGTVAMEDVLDHEAIHVARQHAAGMWRWHARYVLSRRFRWQEERAAYHSTLRRRAARGEALGDAERERLAAVLSGWQYLRMTDRATARAFIDAALAEVPAGPP